MKYMSKHVSIEDDPILLLHIETVQPDEYKFYIRLKDSEKRFVNYEWFILKNGEFRLERCHLKKSGYSQQFIWEICKRVRRWAEIHQEDLELEAKLEAESKEN